jgi:hypothetical protein
MKIIILASVALAITGCSTTSWYTSQSSGAIGCLPKDIKISEVQSGRLGTMTSWVAECKGQQYVCSWMMHGTANCKESK